MFEATVLSLGRFRLFKAEDIGRVRAATIVTSSEAEIVADPFGILRRLAGYC
jgi:hypothetical protein